MARRTSAVRIALIALAGLALGLGAHRTWSAGGAQARDILAATGVKGGLIVHLGCGDGTLTAALRANDRYVVHGLDADAANVEKARATVQRLKLYGPVSVEQWSGARLPYNDNLVNLVVAQDLGAVPMDEVMRVLAPNGVAWTRQNGRWAKTVKPRPADIDEWTHYLHSPGNNAVSHDAVVGPPRRLQWAAGPRYSRHHDHMSSLSAMVSANGRAFYIFDEGSKASILVAPKWFLVARDAFNGTLLWKRPIQEWHSTLWPLKNGPQLLARRLVAIGDRVYVTLGQNAPLVALDAATGATVRSYEGTKTTEEILYSDGTLLLVVNPRGEPGYANLQEARSAANAAWPDEGKRQVMAVQADTGKKLWGQEERILPGTLAVERGRVFYHDGERIVCLDQAKGARSWASPPLSRKSVIQSYFTPTLVAYQDVVLFSGGMDGTDFGGGNSKMVGLSAQDGHILWEGDHPPCGHHTPKDVLVANGLVWCGEVAQSSDSGVMTARDPLTGKVVKQFGPDADVPWFHHRCYRAKATDNFLLFSRTGIEFIDTRTNHWTPNNWVRGACLYGIMPANGLTYAPQHPCACYSETKLSGFSALAPEAKTPFTPAPEAARLVRGPAWGEGETGRRGDGETTQTQIANRQSQIANAEDWPTHRHDGARSGSTKTSVPTNLKSLWEANLGGKLTSVVVADGKLFVAAPEIHTLYALDANSGKTVWRFTAGGRIDSPPTLWQGRAIFGCADGHVYCLAAADGRLAWRYLAAPADRRLVAYDQVESVWPIHGSVLVQDGTAYFVAGRSMFLDGGLRLIRLDARTGRKLSETVMDDRIPETGENLQAKATGMNMPVGLPDVLSSDGRYVYMRSLPFDMEGKRKFVEYIKVSEQKGEDAHLFSPTGFLDDTLWHRTYWVFGRAWASGAGGYYQAGRVAPAGRIMVFDDNAVWGYGRRWQYFRWSTPYVNHLFATARQPEILRMFTPPKPKPGAAKPKSALGQTPTTRFAYNWSDEVPVQACAMVNAGGTLFVAGPPEFVSEDEAAKAMDDPKIQAKLADQGAAYDGKRGAILTAVSAADGAGLGSYRLGSMPTFDGMAAARGRLYLSTTDGKVICLGAGAGKPLARAEDVNAKSRGDADAPPPSAGTPAATTAGASALAPTASHPDFQALALVNVAPCELGYRIEAVDGKTGVALRALPAPLTQTATFKGTMRLLQVEGLLNTGFLVFGDGTDVDQLVKCGIRARMKKAQIIQGADKGTPAAQDLVYAVEDPAAVTVTVDLAAQQVTLAIGKTTVEAKLERPMKSITHVGYGVMNAACEFGPVEVSGR